MLGEHIMKKAIDINNTVQNIKGITMAPIDQSYLYLREVNVIIYVYHGMNL